MSSRNRLKKITLKNQNIYSINLADTDQDKSPDKVRNEKAEFDSSDFRVCQTRSQVIEITNDSTYTVQKKLILVVLVVIKFGKQLYTA